MLSADRERFHTRLNLICEDRDGLVEELRTAGDRLEQQDQELRAYRAAPPSVTTAEVSNLRNQLSDARRELSATKTDYLALEDRNLAFEDEKTALAEQIKSSEAELAAQRIEGKTMMALEHDLALAKGEVSMSLHKLAAGEARWEQQGRAHQRFTACSLSILGPLIAFDLARHYFAAFSLKNRDKHAEVEKGKIKLAVHNWRWFQEHSLNGLTARKLGIPEADAAAINSINLHYNRNLAAHTTLDDILPRAELLDPLGGTTLAKTLVPLTRLDKLKKALNEQIRELDREDNEGPLLFAGEELNGAGKEGEGGEGGSRCGEDGVEEVEGLSTPQARAKGLPPSPQSLASPPSPIDGGTQRRPTRAGSALQSTRMKAPRRSRRAVAGAEMEMVIHLGVRRWYELGAVDEGLRSSLE